MRKYRTAALAVILAMAAIFVTGCTTFDNFKDTFFHAKGVETDTIKIGVLEPQTGNDSKSGELEIRGIELARELAPEVLGKKVELVYADTQSSIYPAETAVADLIDKKPAIVLGSYGEAVSLTASQQLGAVGIPAISITSTNSLITENNEYYFRVTFSDASQGNALAQYTVDKLKQNTAAVVKIKDDDTTSDMISKFSSRMKALTESENAIAASINLDLDQKDYTDSIEKLKASKARTVFLAVPIATAEEFFQAVEDAGLQGYTFLGTKEWHGEELIELQAKFPKISIAVAADFTGTMTSDTDKTDRYEEFLKAYEAKYGAEEPEEATALAFDAYMIAVKAIETAGDTDGEKVKDALKQTTNFSGASGEISFDESGNPKKTINIDVIKDNQVVSVYTVH